MAPKKKVRKGKSSKKKGKKSEKDVVEKQADLFIQSENLHRMFIDRIGTWLLSNFGRVVDIFRKFDRNGDGVLTYEEFFAGMKDLEAPCNQIELFVLAKTVDKNLDGNIEYNEFSQGIRYRRPVKVEQDDGLPVLKISREKFDKCPDCCIKKWNFRAKKSLFYSLDLLLHSMKGITNFTGHLRSLLVESNLTIQGLINKVQEQYDQAFKDIIIFSLNGDCKEIYEIGQTIDDSIGFEGGSEEDPTSITLFYELGIKDLIECPILQSDHYFDRK
uniref:EF-hand domain-containing protein n=1 Tax=Clytia hemisphaerica TaxID=252671 RepID=A0A7M5WX42_9CNID